MPILNGNARSKTRDGDVRPAQEALAAAGALIPVTITLSDEGQLAYAAQGEKPPEAVNGMALVDTGASHTCFDSAAAARARLPIVGVGRMHSASHRAHETPQFSGKIVAPTVAIDVPRGMGASLSDFDDRLIALIGRDVLASAVFVYNGPAGHYSLAI